MTFPKLEFSATSQRVQAFRVLHRHNFFGVDINKYGVPVACDPKLGFPAQPQHTLWLENVGFDVASVKQVEGLRRSQLRACEALWQITSHPANHVQTTQLVPREHQALSDQRGLFSFLSRFDIVKFTAISTIQGLPFSKLDRFRSISSSSNSNHGYFC